MMKWLLFIAAVCGSQCALAQQEMPLYAGPIPNAIEAPDEEHVRDPKEQYPFLLGVSRPTLTMYLSKHRDAKECAVIILPGGSYRGVSIEKEGHAVARAFNTIGIAAFVLKYRTPGDTHMTNRSTAPLQDAEQAVRVVRQRASEWRINANKIGVIGFSAGGHLAATLATQSELRPKFLMLIYPVISMSDELTHTLSRSNLLGAAPTPEAIKKYSLEAQVTPQTPPTFIVHAADDTSVKVGNSIRFFEALQANGVLSEMHIYPRGGHGFGLNNATTEDRWFDRCKAWLISEGFLASSNQRHNW
ncbi:MAG TPA: alpha/beta hydrolase [Steroidobacteraceae bacterium]|nr:alpha/beta hydrolase [Steroidobacteraceae bacterium]